MPRGDKASAAAISKRREQVWQLTLRGYTARQIQAGFQKQGITVSHATLARDMEALRSDLMATRQASELYSLGRAFTELQQIWHEAWTLYARPQTEIPTKDGKTIKMDDRMVKTMLLRELKAMVTERARLCGFYSPKVMERITMIETATGRGIQIERIPFEEQLKRGVDELRNNEGLARSEGIIDQAFPEGSAL
jgi:hypothetical protein